MENKQQLGELIRREIFELDTFRRYSWALLLHHLVGMETGKRVAY